MNVMGFLRKSNSVKQKLFSLISQKAILFTFRESITYIFIS